MPFTEQNMPLLLEAVTIDFQFRKDGRVNCHKHSKRELGLYFIKEAVEIHGNKYGYDKVEYVNNSTKVILTCRTHGDFEKTPLSHIRGGGCPKCSGNYSLTTEEFIEKARNIHGDKYDYSAVQYKNNSEKVEIICYLHGSFAQTPSDHLRGNGCAQCYHDSRKMLEEEFIEKARAVHKDKYDYSSVQYKNNRGKVEIFCPLPNHGSFMQEAGSHINHGAGCPKCAGHNHDILYLLKCLETGWYKIGITTNSTKNRISQIGGNIKEVHHVLLECPREHESILHKKYEKDREYNLCVRNGHTEFFSLTEAQVHEVIAYMNEVSSNA